MSDVTKTNISVVLGPRGTGPGVSKTVISFILAPSTGAHPHVRKRVQVRGRIIYV